MNRPRALTPAGGANPSPRTGPAAPAWGLAAVAGAAALWSLSGGLIKLLNANGVGVPGPAIASYRALLAGMIFLPGAWRHRSTIRSAPWGWLAASVAAFTVMAACFVFATTRTAAANVIVLQYTAPVWVFLLAPAILHERPHVREGAALLVSIAGVLYIFSGRGAGDRHALFLALASGLGYGCLTVILRRLRSVSPYVMVSLNCLGSGLVLLPSAGIAPAARLTMDQCLLLGLLAGLQFALAYMLFSWGLQRVEAHRASLMSLLEALLNPLWTLLLVGEPVPHATLIGGPLILAGAAGWILVRRGAGRT